MDDPGTPNQGRPDYTESSLGTNSFAQTGTAMGWNGYQSSWTLNLPFAFPFSDGTYTQVDVSSSGYLQFGGGTNYNDFGNSDANLANYRRIAPLWSAIRTDLAGDDIFVDTSISGQVTIRWQGSEVQDNSPVNVAVTLYSNGNIRFDYGAGNVNLSPTVGLSMGVNGVLRLSQYDGLENLSNVNSVEFTLGAQLRRHRGVRVPGQQQRHHAGDGHRDDPGQHQRRGECRRSLGDDPGIFLRGTEPDRRQRSRGVRTARRRRRRRLRHGR